MSFDIFLLRNLGWKMGFERLYLYRGYRLTKTVGQVMNIILSPQLIKAVEPIPYKKRAQTKGRAINRYNIGSTSVK